MQFKSEDLLVFFTLFAVSAMLVSLWVGKFFLFTPLIFIASVLIALVLCRFKPSIGKIPGEAWLIALMAASLAAVPLLFIHPFYQGSSDPLHTTTLRVLLINQRIPETYAPFAELPFTYPFAFHLLSKVFADFFFFSEPFLSNWLFGVIFIFIQFVFLYLFSMEFFGSKNAGLLSVALFFGTKTVFQDFYCGMMPRVAASAFILAFLFLYLKKSRLSVLMLAAVAVLHHAMLFGLFLFLALHWLFFRRKIFLLKWLPFGMALALPAILFYYSGLLGAAGSSGLAPFGPVITELLALPLWVGWVPVALFSILFLLSIWKRDFSNGKQFAFLVVLVSSLLFFLLLLLNINGANFLLWFISLGIVLFCVQALCEMRIEKKAYFNHILALLVVLSLIAFFSSGFLLKKFTGSKISPDGAEFAFEFREYDSSLQPTVFFVKSSSKMAELSNKIPFNAASGWFYPLSTSIIGESKAAQELLENQKEFERILEEGCVECIYDLNVRYAVVDSGFFPEEFGRAPVLSKGSFSVYEIQGG